MARDNVFTRTEGFILIVGFFLYNFASYKWAKEEAGEAAATSGGEAREQPANTAEPIGLVSETDTTIEGKIEPEVASSETSSGYIYDILKIGFGLIGLAVGAKVLLFGAVNLAKKVGVSDEVIALTLIAVGTSLPELATAVTAAWRGQSEITLGNVVGSNIFNILGVVGFAALILPLQVSDHMLKLDIPLMVVVTLGVLPIMSSGLKIVRSEGVLLIAAYIFYLYVLLVSNPQIGAIP